MMLLICQAMMTAMKRMTSKTPNRIGMTGDISKCISAAMVLNSMWNKRATTMAKIIATPVMTTYALPNTFAMSRPKAPFTFRMAISFLRVRASSMAVLKMLIRQMAKLILAKIPAVPRKVSTTLMSLDNHERKLSIIGFTTAGSN